MSPGSALNLWYLSASTIPSRAANSVHVMKMCRAFAGAGHRVTLYGWTPRGAREDAFAAYDVEPSFTLRLLSVPRVPRTGGLRMKLALHRDLLRGPRPDLLYARSLEALYALRRTGVPLVLEVHNPPGSARRARLLARLAARPSFAGLVVISEALRREYEARFPALAGRIVVAHDAADPPREPAPADADPAWPGAPDRLQAGYVGSLFPGKGMEMIASLAHRADGVDLHVVGGSEAEVTAWKTRIEAQGTPRAGVWLHGFVPHGELARYYGRCDVFLAPYQQSVQGVERGKDLARWMSPLKIFEYMAAGRPILCSDLPVLREVLRDGENALLLDPEDAGAWAAALDRLRGDAALRARLGEAARNDFRHRHTWSGRAEAVLRSLAPRIPALTR